MKKHKEREKKYFSSRVIKKEFICKGVIFLLNKCTEIMYIQNYREEIQKEKYRLAIELDG